MTETDDVDDDDGEVRSQNTRQHSKAAGGGEV